MYSHTIIDKPSSSAQNTTDDISDKEAQSYYHSHLAPHVNAFEEKRKVAVATKSNRKKTILIPVAILLTVVFASIAYVFVTQEQDFVVGVIVACVFLLVGLAIWTELPVMKFGKEIKDTIFPLIFKYFGDHYTYTRKSLLKPTALKSSGLIPHYSMQDVEDYIQGSYDDVTIEMCEMHLQKKKGKYSHKTVFKGLAILLSTHKNFNGKTIIKRDQSKIGNFLTNATNSLENVKLEDPRFESKFEVYSSDQVEARYLLTPAFMERLLDLENAIPDAGKIQASFYDNRLLLMIPTQKNRFETRSVNETITFKAEMNQIVKEMQDIFSIIKALKLNENTGL